MNSTHLTLTNAKKHPQLVILGLAAALALGACSSGSNPSSAPTQTSITQQAPGTGSGAGGQGGGSGIGRGAPGVSGLVAAVTGSTAQVQGTSSQTAVTWTAGTTVTSQVAIKATDLKVGDCVMARAVRTAGSGGTAGTGTPAPSPTTSGTSPATPGHARSIDAATVEVFAATNGTCSFAGASNFGAGRRPAGSGTGAPTDRPTFTGQPGAGGEVPGGHGRAGGGFAGFGGAAAGTISAIGTSSFTVTPVARTAAGATGTPTTTTQVPVTVSWSSRTTFTTRTKVTSAAIVVGVCVAAQGKTDDTGALTATAIGVSQPVNGACTTGFGLRGGRNSSGGGTGSGTASASGSTGGTIYG